MTTRTTLMLPLLAAGLLVGCSHSPSQQTMADSKPAAAAPEMAANSTMKDGMAMKSDVAAKPSVMVDLVVLNDGFTAADRLDYVGKTQAIAAKHGMRPNQSFTLTKHLGGGVAGATELHLWDMDDPGALGKVGADPAYKANISERDRIHNMKELTLFLATPKKREAIDPNAHVLVDFVVLNDGYTLDDRCAYQEKTETIAAKYGIELKQSYDLVKHLMGGIEQAASLNVWSMPNPEALTKLGNDPEYKANIGSRDAIHNMNALTMYFAKPGVDCH